MYYPRAVTDNLLRLFTQYPVVTVTGPRQSGKTTLCRKVFGNLKYVSLEDLTERDFAEEDPRGFLERYGTGAIIDEVQRVPSLLSYIQTFVDQAARPGCFVLTGSSQFELLDSLNQSLAGRTALVRLLPFTYDEIYQGGSPGLDEVLFRGFYPRIFAHGINPAEMYSFYTNTYIERDVRRMVNIRDLRTFGIFLRICAGRTGQSVNLAAIGGDCGIDGKTVKHWLSILEASYVIRLVAPYYRNLNKRLVKMPKLYFHDTGLACHLLGITEPGQLQSHPLAGAIFETFVFNELYKACCNSVREAPLFYFRDNRGREVDLIIDEVAAISQIEVKRSATVHPSFFKGLKYLETLSMPVRASFLVYGGEESHFRQGVQVLSWRRAARVWEGNRP